MRLIACLLLLVCGCVPPPHRPDPPLYREPTEAPALHVKILAEKLSEVHRSLADDLEASDPKWSGQQLWLHHVDRANKAQAAAATPVVKQVQDEIGADQSGDRWDAAKAVALHRRLANEYSRVRVYMERAGE